ncbi:MAG: hypothetical protein JKX95_02090 [Bacteroidia bacterium]|nr:hypothetical protein [Bacteroidia bacterium]
MSSLINLQDYTVTEHVMFAVGCLLWVFTYVIVIKNIIKHQFVEVPVVAICANFSWEFLWSFVFQTNMGELYVWGYRVWFLMDCFIIYGLFKYGDKQVSIDSIKKFFKPVTAFCLLCWFVTLYFYIKNYDAPFTHMGAYSGYILNVMMSALYITLILRMKDSIGSFSYLAGWFKGVGTLLITIFCFLHFTDGFLLTMCVITGILDATYIYLFSQLRKQPLSAT